MMAQLVSVRDPSGLVRPSQTCVEPSTAKWLRKTPQKDRTPPITSQKKFKLGRRRYVRVGTEASQRRVQVGNSLPIGLDSMVGTPYASMAKASKLLAA
jgi:hypothetical protein